MAVPDPERDRQFYEGVPLRRVVAFLIDAVIILVILGAVSVAGVLLGILTFGLALPLVSLLLLTAGFIYRWLMLTQYSATVGMMATGIELRRADGDPADPMTAFVHTGGLYVSLAMTLLLLASAATMFVTPHQRTLHDMILGAVVINRPA